MNGFEVASCLILGVGTFALLVGLTQWIVNKQQRAYDKLPVRPLVATLCTLAMEQPSNWKDLTSFWSYQPSGLRAYLFTNLSLECTYCQLRQSQLNRKERSLIKQALTALADYKNNNKPVFSGNEDQALKLAQKALLHTGRQHGT